ncbi:hypothetical protein DE146DRAFT_330271 [Phaeosphaeria sp. MPI-PUGE-AT-0046c]|nr:hypothetical protein DE146DRAFT_330271 [Phaeosphaeria sp. MPI-PUGE-AT-0046c]
MSTSIPILFTLPPSSRHEVILLDTSSKLSLKALNKQITATIAASENCKEFMAKHKSTSGPAEIIQEFKIHWDLKQRDGKLWPEYTILTDDNFGAVIELIRASGGVGRDVLEVKVGTGE